VPETPFQLIDGRSLTCADVAQLAPGPLRVSLAPAALRRIEASHAAAVTGIADHPVYGRSTGVGANKVTRVAPTAEHALALLRSHATAAGPLRSPQRVRSMLLVRLNQLAAGGSGISPHAAQALVAMIDADALPPVRELAGIGTGDLTALATTALGLIGEVSLTGALPPTDLGVHDALPFLSSNAATLADAALATHRLQLLARAALAVAALSVIAVDGNVEAFSPLVGERLPGRAGVDVCGTLTRLCRPAPASARIQDPYAVRCLPQVQGCVLDALTGLRTVVEVHLNTAEENPLILAGPDGAPTVVHHGLSNLPGVALACDMAAIAVAQSAPTLLGRLSMLTDPRTTGLAPFLGDGRPGASGIMALEFVAGSALAVLRSAAAPASLGTVSISRGAEDDASFASRAATQLLEAADAYAVALACELVAAARAVRQRGLPVPDAGWGTVLRACRDLPADPTDRDLTGDLAIAEGLLPELARIAAAQQVGDPVGD
jgi:histidine ammonia-lyase